ncbi:MAG: hypothetical protein D4R88_01980 [Methanosarcinales archaeon]|nr:MAG: hypothetical protein D4R88_01980 [Methanosarcinales archaeon]
MEKISGVKCKNEIGRMKSIFSLKGKYRLEEKMRKNEYKCGKNRKKGFDFIPSIHLFFMDYYVSTL